MNERKREWAREGMRGRKLEYIFVYAPYMCLCECTRYVCLSLCSFCSLSHSFVCLQMVVVMLLSVVERNYRLHRTHTTTSYNLHYTDFILIFFWRRRRKEKKNQNPKNWTISFEWMCLLSVATLMCVNAVTIKIVNAVYSLMVKANIAMLSFIFLCLLANNQNNSSFPNSHST